MKFSFPFSNYFSSTSDTPIDNTSGQANLGIQDFKVFSCSELKKASRGLHSSNKIGEGGFGSVYKGRLRDGTFVAIKVLVQRLQPQLTKGAREFICELAAFSVIKHENLVTLRGCCVKGAERFLVYDYMENNSLRNTFLGGQKNRAKFSWARRRDVSLGVATGLIYPHEEEIIHGGITPSNILLDQDFNPKVSGFHLLKMLRDHTYGIVGTRGYMAPEYIMWSQLTPKAVVYSFGVVLLQIVSGLSVWDSKLEFLQQNLVGESVWDSKSEFLQQNLVGEAWEIFRPNTLVDLVDPVLHGNFPEEEAIRFLKVGLLCVQMSARKRPKMSTVAKMLTNEIDINNTETSQEGLEAVEKGASSSDQKKKNEVKDSKCECDPTCFICWRMRLYGVDFVPYNDYVRPVVVGKEEGRDDGASSSYSELLPPAWLTI